MSVESHPRFALMGVLWLVGWGAFIFLLLFLIAYPVVNMAIIERKAMKNPEIAARMKEWRVKHKPVPPFQWRRNL